MVKCQSDQECHSFLCSRGSCQKCLVNKDCKSNKCINSLCEKPILSSANESTTNETKENDPIKPNVTDSN